MHVPHFVYSSIDGHLSGFYLLAIVNNAAMKEREAALREIKHKSLWKLLSGSLIPIREQTRCDGNTHFADEKTESSLRVKPHPCTLGPLWGSSPCEQRCITGVQCRVLWELGSSWGGRTEGDPQPKLEGGEWTLGTAWPFWSLCLLYSCTGRSQMFWAGLESAFGICCREVILNLGYMLASCRVLKKFPCLNSTRKSLI